MHLGCLVMKAQTARDTKLGVGAIVLAVLGLSAGSTIVRASHLPGPVVAFWRLLIAASIWHFIVFVIGRRNRGPSTVSWSALRQTMVPGLLFACNIGLFFTAATKTPIAHVEFIGALTPVIMVPLAARRLGERVSARVLVLGIVALGGIGLILFAKGSAPSNLVGDALCAVAVLAWICYLLTTREVRSRLGTPFFMAGMSTWAFIGSIPVALFLGAQPENRFIPDGRAWLLILFMALVAGVTSHGLITWAQQRTPVSTITLIQLGQPGIGAFWAWLFLNQQLVAVQVLGMLIMLAAVGGIAYQSTR
jgi:drug/metabolite transporter (DMT)-like permease